MKAPAVVLAVGVALVVALTWPMAARLGEVWHPSAFGASHAWTARHLLDVLVAGEPLGTTCALGYPRTREAHFIGWVPALATFPLQAWLGTMASYQVVELLILPLNAVACWPLLRRLTDADDVSLGVACLIFGFSPYLLGTLAMGETPKLQAWCLPIFFWALLKALAGERGGVPLVAGVSLATSFTSPYYGLLLPLLTVPMAGWAIVLGRVRAGVAATAAVALSMLPAKAYFEGIPDEMPQSIFQPALGNVDFVELPHPRPVAALVDLAFGSNIPRQGLEAMHVAYLGLPVLVVVLVLALRRQRGTVPGLLMLGWGAVLAMGPWLAVTDHLTSVPLPAIFLEAIDYPYAQGGQYFRLVVLATLGLAVLLAAGCAKLRYGPVVAAGLFIVHVGDAVTATGPWPWRVDEVPDAELLSSLAGDDGAVLQLPLQSGPSQTVGQRGILLGLFHGRPTTSLPRDVLNTEVNVVRADMRSPLRKQDGAERLRAAGVRLVILDETTIKEDEPLERYLSRLQGERHEGVEVTVWDLGPAEPACLGLPAQSP